MLYGFATGLFALAASHAHLRGIGWSATCRRWHSSPPSSSRSARNEYGDGDKEGVVIHIHLVYGLGALYLAAPLSMAAKYGRDHPLARLALIGLATACAVGAPLFLMVPTTIDGLSERVLGLIACAILGVMA